MAPVFFTKSSVVLLINSHDIKSSDQTSYHPDHPEIKIHGLSGRNICNGFLTKKVSHLFALKCRHTLIQLITIVNTGHSAPNGHNDPGCPCRQRVPR